MLTDRDIPVYKVVFIGDADVGKTSIITRYVTKQFLDFLIPTVGMSHVQVAICFGPDEFIVNLWDTAGQERYRSLVPLYTRDAIVIVLVFAVDVIATFQHLDGWLTKLRDELQLSCPVIVVANKTDLEFAIDKNRFIAWAKDKELRIVMTSAKTGENVQQLFLAIGELLANAVQSEVRKKLPIEGSEIKERSCC
jgi:small GTP-binding protein